MSDAATGTERGPVDRVSFDEQAGAVFDARAGFPDGVAERIAGAVRDYTAVRPGDLILEIGAGTGLIGQWLARPPARYVGLDSSLPMLDVFRHRLRDAPAPTAAAGDAALPYDPAPTGTAGPAALAHADANRPWPVADGSVTVVFGSRVFQLLDRDHLLREAGRVADPTRAVLVQGTITRDRDSPKDVLRRAMHDRLRAYGLTPRPAGRLLRQVIAQAAATGGTVLAPRTVASWLRDVRPMDVLDEWRQKYSMGGVTPPADVHAAILSELDSWLVERYGDPSEPVATEESYVIEGVELAHTKE